MEPDARQARDRVRSLVSAHPLATLIVIALAVRFALTPLYAHLPNGLLDEGFWKHWMMHIHSDGVLNIFRTTDTDYVGYHWVLWLLAGIYKVIGGPYTQTTPSLHILVKMPSLAFDVLLIVAVYHLTAALVQEDRKDREGIGGDSRLPLWAASVIAFQPAVLYDSAVWAQTDSAITAAMLGAILLAWKGRPALAGAGYALGLAVKPHPIIIGPLLLLALFRNGRWRATMLAAGAGGLVGALVLGPWILHGDTGRIIDVYRTMFTNDHHRLSELAWNMGWIFDYRGDPRGSTAVFSALPFLTFRILGLALSSIAAGLALAYAGTRPGLRGALIAAAYLAFAFYALPVGSHERYLYPFLAFLLPVAMCDRRWLWLYVPMSVTFFLNLVVAAPPVSAWMDRWVYSEFGAIVAGINMAFFAAYGVVLATGIAERVPWRHRPSAMHGHGAVLSWPLRAS